MLSSSMVNFVVCLEFSHFLLIIYRFGKRILSFRFNLNLPIFNLFKDLYFRNILLEIYMRPKKRIVTGDFKIILLRDCGIHIS